MSSSGWARRFVASVLAVATLSALIVVQPTPTAQALSGSQFDPGNIISDQYFYDRNAMSQAEIQAFLNQKVGTCLNTNCLNVLKVDTFDRPAIDQCAPYVGALQEPASAIIYKVQQACGISAKVLLVTLQKEQGLVTRTAPSDLVLRKAMGYGCPDTADCDARYYGFYNQMYHAAKQFAWYRVGYSTPGSNFYQKLGPGRYSQVLFNPNTACGSAPVLIHNFATAALYHYTPYQPNAAALANLGGTGDGCSSYGNRNFWVHYSNWFGNPTVPPGTPEGDLTGVSVSPAGVQIDGWSVDPDSTASGVVLSIQLGSSWHAVVANQPGSDLNEQYPGAGSSHAFSALLPAPAGVAPLCIYMVNAGGVGAMGSLGCRTVTVPEAPATVGEIESTVVSPGRIEVAGWAVRPDALSGVVGLAVNIGARWIPMVTGTANATAPLRVSGAGPNQGYSVAFDAPAGTQTFCVWANRTVGAAVLLGCRTVTVPAPRATLGAIESVTVSGPEVTVSGWAVWPDSPSTSVGLAFNIGSAWQTVIANTPSTSAEAAVPGSGGNHGFSGTVTLPVGVHQLCVWAHQQAGSPTILGCRTVTVNPVAAVSGDVTAVVGVVGGIRYEGWAVLTADRTAPVSLAGNVGTTWIPFTTGEPNDVAPQIIPGAGPSQGYSALFPASPGQHTICVWANGGPLPLNLGCKTVTVVASPALVGAVTSVEVGSGTLALGGWAVAPEALTTARNVAVNIDNRWITAESGLPNEDAPKNVVGAGPNQGYRSTITLTSGSHAYCVYASGPVSAVALGCGMVTIP